MNHVHHSSGACGTGFSLQTSMSLKIKVKYRNLDTGNFSLTLSILSANFGLSLAYLQTLKTCFLMM